MSTTPFRVAGVRVYPGPSVPLAQPALVFTLSARPDLPVADLWARVVARFPELSDEGAPAVFAELFARAVIQVQRLGLDLYATDWSVTPVGAPDDEPAGAAAATVAVQYVDDAICARCIELVADWLTDELDGREFDFERRFADVLRRFVRGRFGGPTIYSLLEAGQRAGIPSFLLDSEDVVQWGYGRKQLRGRSTVLHVDSVKDTELTMYKDRAKAFLEDLGLPVPRGEIVFTRREAEEAAARLGSPLVTKPVAGHKGQGVTTGITSARDLEAGFDLAMAASKTADDGVIVEQQISGTDHRLLTVKGRFVAALQRVPAYVVGDGRHSIEELITLENARPERADTPRSPLGKIVVDDLLVEFVREQGHSLGDVLATDENLVLRRVANLSAGGVSRNVTDAIHPLNVKLAEDVAKYFDVRVLGIDVLAADITRPWTESPLAIIEVNAGPGVFMHLAPAEGASIDVPLLVLRSQFATADAARVPVLVCNRLDADTARRLTDVARRFPGVAEVGAARLEGLWCNDAFFSRRPAHTDDIRNMLRSPQLDVALIEYDEAHLLAEGLFHMGADVVVLDQPTAVERATLTRDLLPGGAIVEIHRHAGQITVTNDAGRQVHLISGTPAATLAEVLAPVIAGFVERYTVRAAAS